MRSRAIVALAAVGAIHCSKPSAQPAGALASAPGVASASSHTDLPAAIAHPCGLLDRSDVEAALGTTDFAAIEGPGKTPAGAADCTWHVATGGGFVKIALPHPSVTMEDFDRNALLMKRAPLAGLGDKAYVDPKMTWGLVDVMKNGQKFVVRVSRGDEATGTVAVRDAGMTTGHETLQDTAITLARKLASKL